MKSLILTATVLISVGGLTAKSQNLLQSASEELRDAPVFSQETVNPDAELVADDSLIRANPASDIVRDTAASLKGNRDERETVSPDAEAVTDDSPIRANAASEILRDAPGIIRSIPEKAKGAAENANEQAREVMENPKRTGPLPKTPDSPISSKAISREEIQSRMSELRRNEKLEKATDVTPPVVEAPVVAAPENRISVKDLVGEARKMVEGQPEPDREMIEKRANELHTEAEAKSLVDTILGVAPKTAPANLNVPTSARSTVDQLPAAAPLRRLDAREVGRTVQDREDTVTSIVNQFLGRDLARNVAVAPNAAVRSDVRAQPSTGLQFYEGNRRVVRYQNRDAIPPILLATGRLNRVEVSTVGRAQYLVNQPTYAGNIPSAYREPDAYAVSYQVDPQSVVTRDDILFQQGSTAFADAYSFDIVADLAEAMRSPQLRGEEFVIEGHASAEGSYELNLELSQRRAERIARDLVGYGVNPGRLVPVGYGETEARFPANALESQRALDRRVLVFRME